MFGRNLRCLQYVDMPFRLLLLLVYCPHQDDEYNFPILDVCFWGGRGCDENREDADCITSATVWVGDPCFDEVVEDVQTTSKVSAQLLWSKCM